MEAASLLGLDVAPPTEAPSSDPSSTSSSLDRLTLKAKIYAACAAADRGFGGFGCANSSTAAHFPPLLLHPTPPHSRIPFRPRGD